MLLLQQSYTPVHRLDILVSNGLNFVVMTHNVKREREQNITKTQCFTIMTRSESGRERERVRGNNQLPSFIGLHPTQ